MSLPGGPMNKAEPYIPAQDMRQQIQKNVIAWFAATARDLPWRHTRDPYRILIAEIMLQQTQVDRVLPKYTAFLQTFPDMATLAAAPTADVIRHWAGLGYNRRAVNLQRTARQVLEEHNGSFPQDMDSLQRLPGIGPYTAGAIACFAFEQDVAFLDTNMRRVLHRCLIGAEPPVPPLKERTMLQLAAAMVPAGAGWQWNQALMELGALLCTARVPACIDCPLQTYCMACTTWQTTETIYKQTPRKKPAKSIAERRAPFIGSNRYYRGRLIDVLRSLPSDTSLPLDQIGQYIHPETEPSSEWVRTLVEGLVRDGLVELIDEQVRLPLT